MGERVVEMSSMVAYNEHCVDDDPIIVLPCGHFYAVSTLDGWLEIHRVYEMNGAGEFVEPKSLMVDLYGLQSSGVSNESI